MLLNYPSENQHHRHHVSILTSRSNLTGVFLAHGYPLHP